MRFTKVRFIVKQASLALACLCASGNIRAETVEINFDPPAFQDGQVLARVGDIGFFGNVKVFRPSIATQSPPQALHASQWCASTACPTASYVISISLQRPATEVSLRVGSELPPASAIFCFPEGTSCGVYAQLIGRATNNPIVQTGEVLVFDASTMSAPITRELRISDPYGRINGVDLYVVGRGPYHEINNPGRVQIDNLRVTFPDSPLPQEPQPPAAPTIQILEPSSPIPYPYQFTASGRWTSPAGVYGLCLRVNEDVPVINRLCTDNTTRGTDTFSINLNLPTLPPTGNVLNVGIVDLAGRKVTASRPLQLLPPPPPVVNISTPAAATTWTPGTQTPIAVGGSSWIPGGVAGFCVRVSQPPSTVSTPARADCQDQNRIGSNGTFSGVPIDETKLRPGSNEITAFAYDAWGQVGKSTVRGTVPANLRITGVEITQGSQTFDTPSSSGPYIGVKLRKGIPTIVRVFANASAGGPFPGINATLEGFRSDVRAGEVSLGILLPDNGRRDLSAGFQLSLADRVPPNGSYVFTLPISWTANSSIRLRATVNNPGFSGTAVECSFCRPDNVVDVSSINFYDPLASQTISPVNIRWRNAGGLLMDSPPPNSVFADFATMAPMPASTLTIRPYVAVIDASKFETSAGPIRPNGIPTTGVCDTACQGELFGLVSGFENSAQPGFTIGISTAGVQGYTAPVPYAFPPRIEMVAVASTTFNIESLKLQVGHEVLHQFGFLHASGNCRAQGQVSTSWPPDFEGRLQGVGLDRRPNSGGTPGTYLAIVDRPAPLNAHDVMSYCAVGQATRDWLSPRYWNSFGDTFTFGIFCGQGNCTFGAAPEPPDSKATYRALALEGEGGSWSIIDVARGHVPRGYTALSSSGSRQPLAGEDVRFLAQRRDGSTLSLPATVEQGFDRGSGGRLAIVEIPATDLRSIALLVRGVEKARRVASAKAPTIVVPQPIRFEPVANSNEVRVAWQVADEDGGPLSIRVEYSLDDGAKFHPIGVTADRNGMELPKRLFSAANAARLRFVVSDGFNEMQFVSDAFKSEGDLPVVAIREPVADLEMLSTGTLNLIGAAFNDRGEAIPEGDLRWSIDGKPFATGLVAEFVQPRRGRHVVTLVATDYLGREAQVSRVVVVKDGNIERIGTRDTWRVLLVILLFALLLVTIRWRR